MKDIKSLYLEAKSSGLEKDINAYVEHVRYLLENKPHDYMSGIEYIISSSIGLETLQEFVDKYGLSVTSYEHVMSHLENGIKKSLQKGQDDSLYKESIEKLESFKKKFFKNFVMYETFSERATPVYTKYYYERTKPLLETADQLYSRFGLVIIPDMVIECVKNETVADLMKVFIESNFDPSTNQWILESLNDLKSTVILDGLNIIWENSLDGIADVAIKRNTRVFRESVLTKNENLMIELSHDEVKAMEDLISFKEYMVTCLEDVDEITKLNNEVLKLYEELGNFVDDGESSAAMANDMNAPSTLRSPAIQRGMETSIPNAQSLGNTRNKYTGAAPDYLKKNHALGWGEDDTPSDPQPDDFRRPVSDETEIPADGPGALQDLKDDIEDAETPEEKQQAINNYYYYTYHNSHNKNIANIKQVDHSQNKRIHSDNIRGRDHVTGRGGAPTPQEETEEPPVPQDTSPISEEEFNQALVDIRASDEPIENKRAQIAALHARLQANQPDTGGEASGNFNQGDSDAPLVTSEGPLGTFCQNSPMVQAGRSDWDLIHEYADTNFHYTYRVVTGEDGERYLITFDIDGPGVINYKLHYPDISDPSVVKYVGTIPAKWLKKYGNANYVSTGNRVVSIKNIKTGEKIDSIVATGAVPNPKDSADPMTTFEYRVGEKAPFLSYKTTIPIYAMMGTMKSPFGDAKGLDVHHGKMITKKNINPFRKRRFDLSKPIQYREKYAMLAPILKATLLHLRNDLETFRDMSLRDIELIIDKDMKKNTLYRDYLIKPLDIHKYNKLLTMSAIFLRNVARNIFNEPWSTLPLSDLYDGLLIGFFGPALGGKDRHINIDILEPQDSDKYMVNTNIFQNIHDWFTILANVYITKFKTPKDKADKYLDSNQKVIQSIKDTFYNKNLHNFYEAVIDNITIDDEFMEGIFDWFKKKTEPTTPQIAEKRVYSTMYIPMSRETYDQIIGPRSQGVRAKVDAIIKPFSEKYPIFALHTQIEDEETDFSFGVLSDDPNAPGNHIRLDGVEVKKVRGKYFLHATLPTINGADQFEFYEDIKNNHPEEYQRIIDLGYVNRYDWTHVHWEEKVLGYDMTLTQIMNEIENQITTAIPEATNWEYWGDNDSGPVYGFELEASYFYPDFNPSQIRVANWTYTKEMYNSSDSLVLSKLFEATAEEIKAAEMNKPTSDHPVKDRLTDLDRRLSRTQQAAKKRVQDAQNVGRALVKPAKRTAQWISNTINQWKDADENRIKSKLADPHARGTLFKAIRASIIGGSLFKAGLLLNPIFLFLAATKTLTDRGKKFRLRNEMIGELKAEMEVIDEKIRDAGSAGDNKAKYQLMRLKNELNKKLIRVGAGAAGDRRVAKIL